MCSYTACALLNWRLRSKSSARLYMLSITASLIGTRRKRSKAVSSWPWPCSARPIMRLVSADSSSDLSLPRLGDQEALGGERQVADQQQRRREHQLQPDRGAGQQPEFAADQQRRTGRRDAAGHAGRQPRQQRDQVGGHQQEHAAARPSTPQAGCTMKCSPRMLEVMWAIISTGDSAGVAGRRRSCVPTPAAVAPISTILSVYLAAGILPVSTS